MRVRLFSRCDFFFNDWILNFVQFPIGFLFFAIFKFSFLFVLVLMSVLDNGSDHVKVDKIREPNVLSFLFPRWLQIDIFFGFKFSLVELLRPYACVTGADLDEDTGNVVR